MHKTPVMFATRAILSHSMCCWSLGHCGSPSPARVEGAPDLLLLSQDGHHTPFKEWQVIDTATGHPVSLDQWMALLLQQDIIYLGEEHHNRFHIDAALTVLRRLKAEGRTPALAMEMFGWDGQSALDQYVSGSDNKPPGFP